MKEGLQIERCVSGSGRTVQDGHLLRVMNGALRIEELRFKSVLQLRFAKHDDMLTRQRREEAVEGESFRFDLRSGFIASFHCEGSSSFDLQEQLGAAEKSSLMTYRVGLARSLLK
jgi:hypothetical protein